MSSRQPLLSRRAIVRSVGVAVAAGVAGTTPTTVAADHDECPHVEILEGCLQARVDYDPEPDSVALHMQDGSIHEFTEFEWDSDGDFGYGGVRNDGQVQGWHGSIDRVEVQTGSKTVLVDADGCPSTDVTCSFFESEMEFADLRMQYDDAFKDYGRLPSNTTGGSPGRAVTRISDNYLGLTIELDGTCEPESAPAVEFDCTSVTLHADEFEAEYGEFYGAELHFADGSTETIREVDETFEPPETSETYAGSGEHQGKVISRFNFGQPGDIHFRYDNPDSDACNPGDGPNDDDDAERDGEDEENEGDEEEQEAEGDELPDERHLELTTSADVAEYELAVEGEADPGDGTDTWSHEYQDTVECDGDACEIHGYVADGGVDDYYVRGEVVAAESDEPVTATLDGSTMSLSELVDGETASVDTSEGTDVSAGRGGSGMAEWVSALVRQLVG